MKPMKNPHYHWLTRGEILTAAIITVGAGTALGQQASTTEWNGATGDWSDPTWTAGVPGTDSLAGVENGGTVTVAGPAAADLEQLRVGGGSILNLGSSVGVVGTDLIDNDPDPDTPATGFYLFEGTLNVNSGGALSVTTGGDFWLGDGANGVINLISGGSISTDREVRVGIGGSSTSSLIQTGGSLTHTTGEFRVGAFDASGTYNISGGTAQINTLKVGYAGQGNGQVTISGAGTNVTLNGETSVAWDALSSGTLTVEGGTVVANNRLRIGVAGGDPGDGSRSASYLQTGGTVTVNEGIDIGGNTPAAVASTVGISSGVLETTQSVDVGHAGSGSGVLNVSGDADFRPASLFVSRTATSTGTVNLSGGATTLAGEFTVGENSAATSTAAVNISGDAFLEAPNFRIRNGIVTQSSIDSFVDIPAGGELFVGIATGASAVTQYNLSGGDLVVGNRLRIGVGTAGSTLFNQTGGSVDVTGRLDLVENGGASNTYQISAGSLMTSAQGFIGAYGSGTATFDVSGTADVDFGGNMEIGRESTTATVNLTGGSVSAAQVYLGAGSGSSALNLSSTAELVATSFRLKHGTFTQSDSTSLFDVNGEGIVGVNNSTDATYNMQDGTLEFLSRLRIGATGGSHTNTFNQTGGSVDLKNRLDMGEVAGPTNIYQISAGSLSLTGGDQRILVGAFNDGTGTLTISGTGQIEAQSIVLGESATAVGTMNLDGGRVVTDFIKTGAAAAGTQTMNLNGGTIEARVDAAQGLTGNLPANLLAGGVTFDVPDAAWTASTSGIMTGVGSLTKTGPGRLTVLGDQQYTGDTIVEGGILRLDDPYLDPASDIYLTTGVLLELDFESQIDVGTIYLDGVPQPAGVYDNTSALIAGAGSLNSTTGPSPGVDVVVDSFTLDTSGPTRMAVIEITGTPNSDYVCKASTDLTNFVTVATETTDGSGNATFSVEADETAEFFIVEDAPN